MKIKSISCTQFAGIKKRDVSLKDGLNVIYGKNETGKSTLVNLLSRTLFQKAKVGDKLKSDTDFKELYFPGDVKDGEKGDFADGEITFETKSGSYKLSKEWSDEPRCVLSTPGGAIRDQNKIDEILKEQLVYGEGVYSEMLFSSQHNTDVSLQTILGASKNSVGKKELVDALSKAVAESDGYSIEDIEQAIEEKINKITGKHWDNEKEAPKNKRDGGRWENEKGAILDAYYKQKDAEKVLNDINELEKEADRAAQDFKEQEKAVQDAEKELAGFKKIEGDIAAQNEHKKTIKRIEPELNKLNETLAKWNGLSPKLERAEKLQAEKVNRELADKFHDAKKIKDKIAELEQQIAGRGCPSDKEISQANFSQREITKLENKLCGMNLNAAVQMFNGHNVEITSLRTGEPVTLSGGTAAISEAVKITVPGVMEMQLSPADVNVSEVQNQIAAQKKILNDFLGEYKVESVKAAQDLVNAFSDKEAKEELLKTKLGDTPFEELETKVKTIVTVRPLEEIKSEIRGVCGSDDVDGFINSKNGEIGVYIREHNSIDNLQKKIDDLSAELQEAENERDKINIPEEFRNISDADAYREQLQNNLNTARELCQKALVKKTQAERDLETFQENHPDDPKEVLNNAKLAFEEQNTLLKHWLHIKEVFMEEKAKIQDNPMRDIAEHFSDYLNSISNGRVSSEFPEANKLDMKIYSKNNLMDYGKLSEGTKETVSLAYRLAVLEHLFPNGGVIVLDDPFTDMDEERVAQSCELVKKCAEHHQVILLTCREEYLKMLDGNVVKI